MKVRKIREEDLDAVVGITLVCFEGVSIDQNIEKIFGKIGGTDWKWRKKCHISADVDANADGIFVVEEDEKVVGYVTTRLDQYTKMGWIPNIAVSPKYQRRGFGKLLMEAAFEYLREQGMEYVKIETLEQNEIAKKFYPKVGFQEVARQIHYLKRL